MDLQEGRALREARARGGAGGLFGSEQGDAITDNRGMGEESGSRFF